GRRIRRCLGLPRRVRARRTPRTLCGRRSRQHRHRTAAGIRARRGAVRDADRRPAGELGLEAAVLPRRTHGSDRTLYPHPARGHPGLPRTRAGGRGHQGTGVRDVPGSLASAGDRDVRGSAQRGRILRPADLHAHVSHDGTRLRSDRVVHRHDHRTDDLYRLHPAHRPGLRSVRAQTDAHHRLHQLLRPDGARLHAPRRGKLHDRRPRPDRPRRHADAQRRHAAELPRRDVPDTDPLHRIRGQLQRLQCPLRRHRPIHGHPAHRADEFDSGARLVPHGRRGCLPRRGHLRQGDLPQAPARSLNTRSPTHDRRTHAAVRTKRRERMTTFADNASIADLDRLKVLHNGSKTPLTFSEAEMERRLTGLRAIMAEQELDAVILTSYHNIKYYSDFLSTYFGRSYAMVVTADDTVTITANIDAGMPWRTSYGENIVYTDWRRDNYYYAIQEGLRQRGIANPRRLGVEDDNLPLHNRDRIQAAFPDAELIDVS